MPSDFDRLAALEPWPGSDEPLDGPRSAVAVLLRGDDLALEVLLMLRAEREGDRWSGHISLPGGHHQPEDADLLATAHRETREEVGVDVGRAARLLGRLPTLQAVARGRLLELRITPFVFQLEREVRPSAGPEARDVFWFPLGRAARGELDATYAYEHEGRTLALPSWRHHGRTVWGLTHRILSGLLRPGDASRGS